MRTADLDLGAIESALADLVHPAGPQLRSGVRRIAEVDEQRLFDVELQTMARFAPSRAREFAAGRLLLRELLGAAVAIPVAANRAPVLPAGFVGSLAHDDQFVVAVVSDVCQVGALGIDIEPMDRLSPEVSRLVLRPDETIDAHLAFTLKEAAYKAWSSLGGAPLEHHDIRVHIDDGSFTAHMVTGQARVTGLYRAVAGRWIAQVVHVHSDVQQPTVGAVRDR